MNQSDDKTLDMTIVRSPQTRQKLFFLGVGQAALSVARNAQGRFNMCGTTRDANKITLLTNANISPIFLKTELTETDKYSLTRSMEGANLLVSFPPDGISDRELALLSSTCRSIIYISSTGVYGGHMGLVDESTPVDYGIGALRLGAEGTWRKIGAVVLRCAGIYGPDSGLHLRLKKGTYRMPGNGSNYTSRIHIEDLARIVLAAFEKPLPKGATYVVGDLKPARQYEVISWLCELMQLPMPAGASLNELSVSLRGNRQVSSSKILKDLNLTLNFPTYKEGYIQCLQDFQETGFRD
jgi:hypothetical protein